MATVVATIMAKIFTVSGCKEKENFRHKSSSAWSQSREPALEIVKI